MRKSAIGKRVGFATAVALASAGLIGTTTTPANAAGLNLLASTTTLSAVMTATGNLALTSTVAISGLPSLGITPSGTVTFSDDAHDNLGTVKLSSCLLTTCTVQQTVAPSRFAGAVNSITATYSGDLLLKPSAAAAPVVYRRCVTAAGCFGALVNSTTAVGIGVPVNDTVLATLGGSALPCSVGAGSVLNLSVSGTGKSLTVQLSHSGAASTTYQKLDGQTRVAAAHTNYRCDVSTGSYQGFSPGSATFTRTASDFAQYGNLPKLATGAYQGQYAGLIPDCTYWFAHSATTPPVCNSVPATPPTGTDVTFLVFHPGSGISHIAG